tara:strand:- start:185 stop:805 length:621 start_codon:yes stop_codon:yes gene_type:complete
MYLIKIKAKDDLFNGTLIDGELIQSNGRYSFLAFDTLLYCGKNMTTSNLDSRRECINSFLKSIIQPLQFTIVQKNMYNLNDYKQDIFETDGLIFTPIYEKIHFGTNYKMFKWKPQMKNTVDFLIDENYSMYLGKNGNIFKTNNHISKSDKFVGKGIYECEYISNNYWKLIFLRHDKDFPNNVFTYQKTLFNIEENIKFHEMFALSY